MKNLTLSLVIFLLTSISYAQNSTSWKITYGPRGRTINAVKVLDINTILTLGGNETNDSILSIFRSTNRGVSWDLISDDAFSAWLKDVSFINTITGYAAGWTGKILKTTDGGVTWIPKPATGNVSHRNFNGVYFITDQIGYVVGGNRSLDSIQTILKTTDGGDTWSVQRDVLGRWLNSVYFTNTNNGIAVGDKGVILRTTDGGTTWNTITVSGGAGSRNFSKVYFRSASEGYIVGGNTRNDSIRTILKTTDGGTTWNILQDNLANKANAIDFYGTNNGIIVGDKGDLLTTSDGGNVWNPLVLPDSINDKIDLVCTHFFNIDFGVAAGKFGKILIYENNIPILPVCTTGNSLILSNNSVRIEALVNASSAQSTFEFEYGLTPTLGSTISAIPGTLNTNINTSVYATLSSLAEGVYYYRIKGSNLGGDAYGTIKQFYIGSNPIPNFDFELWKTDTNDIINEWTLINNVTKGLSYDGSIAAVLQSSANDATSAIVAGQIGDNGPVGGIPFTEHPDSVVGYFKYDLVAGFDALGLLFMKKDGNIISQDILSFSGSTGGQFIRKSFPISWPNATIIPDSLILGFVNNNPFAGTSNPLNVLEIDNISFVGATQNVPNANMENWGQSTWEKPISWSTSDARYGNITNELVKKTSNAAINKYALELRTLPNKGTIGMVSTNTVFEENNYPGIPSFSINHKFEKLAGYYKFLKEGNDTAAITINVFKNNNIIGSGTRYFTDRDSVYTYFTDSIIYTQNEIPDSATIHITAYKNDPRAVPMSNSILFIDALSFDSRLDTTEIPTTIKQNTNTIKQLKLYPNPARDYVAIEIPNMEVVKSIEIFNLSGNNVYSETINNQYENVRMFNVSNLANGVYFIRVQLESTSYINKFVVNK
ncbi:MAG: YCF48-related protein [Chitinophagales bacterium]